MKNLNTNASVANFWRRINDVRALHAEYQKMLSAIQASQSDESWPPYDRDRPHKVTDPDPTYQISWGLRIGSGCKLEYDLDVINAATRIPIPWQELPLGAMERMTELRRALEDYLHRGGDWPTPNHCPGGSQLGPG